MTSPGPWAHLQCQAPANTEASSAGSKPEIDGFLKQETGSFINITCPADKQQSINDVDICKKKTLTYHFIVTQSFRGLYGPVQTGFADVHVLGVLVLRQELHQSPNVYIVVIVHVTEPSEGSIKREKRNLISKRFYRYAVGHF